MGTARISKGVDNATSELFSAQPPITAIPASKKPMSVEPESPKKIFAFDQLYGKKPAQEPIRDIFI